MYPMFFHEHRILHGQDTAITIGYVYLNRPSVLQCNIYLAQWNGNVGMPSEMRYLCTPSDLLAFQQDAGLSVREMLKLQKYISLENTCRS